jgi:lipopolysaccharide/colanic/teichoic acid biosynthesis glycosyltransferase
VFPGYELGRRVVDVLASAIVPIVCLRLCALIAVAIRLESCNGILFVQGRAGRNGDPLKTRSDPRATRVGRILRRTNRDGLSQFFNVPAGDVSLVGPRRLPVSDAGHHGPLPADVREDMVEQWLVARQGVPPAITGIWQIHGRSLVPLPG